MTLTETHEKIAHWLPLLAVAVVALALSACSASERGAGGEAKLQRALDQVVAAGVPGTAVLVRQGDRTIRLASGHGT